MTGQDAVNVAEQFAEAVDFDGVVMTKLDGDARGGAALRVKAVTGKPILFASTGEKLEQFERFHPDRMAQRILGMGDVHVADREGRAAVRRGRGRPSSSARCAATSSRWRTSSSSSSRSARWARSTSLLGMIPGSPASS